MRSSAQRSGTVLIMTYIGGEAYYVGAVLGAITFTWLQTSLSGYTSAWLLYLGLFFIAMILYAPAGLAGLLMKHGPSSARARLRVLGAYARRSAARVMAAGPSGDRDELSTRHTAGTRNEDADPLDGRRCRTAAPWIVALALLAGGFLLLSRTWPHVAAAWQRASDEASA